MKKLRNYIKLMRLKHCIKNVLIWLPLVFSGSLFNIQKLENAILGFMAFTFMASAVYIINDIQDAPKDRLHPVKKNRPIASGAVSVSEGKLMFIFCVAISLLLNFIPPPTHSGAGSYVCLLLYLVLNVFYSNGIKNIPILDIVILTSGFLIRLIYGGLVTDIPISGWLYLTVITVSFYMSLGKRRNEISKSQDGSTRKVLRFYSYAFLDKNMYMCLGMAEVFYALWAIDRKIDMMFWTVPLVIVLGMKYSLDIEGDSYGDPVEVIVHDKALWIIAAIYAVMVLIAIYAK